MAKLPTAIAAALAGAFLFCGVSERALADDCGKMRLTIHYEIQNLENKLAMKQAETFADPTGIIMIMKNGSKIAKPQHKIAVLKDALRNNKNCPGDGPVAQHKKSKGSGMGGGGFDGPGIGFGGPGIMIGEGGHHGSNGDKQRKKKKKKGGGMDSGGGGCAC
jgi:hypothetical protein